MKKTSIHLHIWLIICLLAFTSGCTAQDNTNVTKESTPEVSFWPNTPENSQIAEYIRHIFQDKNGHLWLGTNGYGVAHYNGDSLLYYSNEQGFGGGQITGICEDPDQNIWFATDQGVVKYDWATTESGEKSFTNYPSAKYFEGKRFWSIYADSKGIIWAGAGGSLYRFDGTDWKTFEFLYPIGAKSVSLLSDVTTWSVLEDSKGNFWFGTNGNGAIQYDGNSFTQYTTEEGLAGNSIDPMIEDSKGNIWMGTRDGGMSKFDGKTFTNYTYQDSIGDDEVCIIYEDKAGNIWCSSEGFGVYRFDGKSFTNFYTDEGLYVKAVQAIFEDREGRFWVGGGGGLYRWNGDSFVNVTKGGPWE